MIDKKWWDEMRVLFIVEACMGVKSCPVGLQVAFDNDGLREACIAEHWGIS